MLLLKKSKTYILDRFFSKFFLFLKKYPPKFNILISIDNRWWENLLSTSFSFEIFVHQKLSTSEFFFDFLSVFWTFRLSYRLSYEKTDKFFQTENFKVYLF